MCTFNDDLEMPKFSKNTGKKFKAPITMFLKPGDYRFRLLKYNLAGKNDRDYPFIERHIHDHWSVNDKGYKLPDDTVVCLKTHYIDHKGNRKNDCPMCRAADEALAQWSASGFKDPVSGAKFNAMKSKYQGIIPVFVIKDSNNPKNEGQMKCFMFTDKKIDRTKEKQCPPELNNPNYILSYDEFHAAVLAKISEIVSSGGGYSIWNGKNAVDVALRVSEIPVTYNRGKPNEYVYKKKVITKLLFTTKPYDIDKINQTNIEAFEFDDQYYVKNSINDIQNFLKRNYSTAVANIPDEDIDLGDDTPTPTVVNTPTSTPTPPPVAKEKIDDMNFDDLDSDPAPATITKDPLETDPEDAGLDNISDSDLDDILSEADVS